MSTLRQTLYKHLDPAGWPGKGLSPVNRWVAILIVLAVFVGILETEVAIRSSAPGLFNWLEWILVLAFTVEYIARVYSAAEDPAYAGLGGRLRYMLRFWSLVDLLAILPFLLTLGTFNGFLLRLFRFFRLLRLARLGRYTDAWDVLADAFRSRRYELGISIGLAALILVLSSALLYLVEGAVQPEAFGSIPRALWWSIATLTTVGYGDVAPLTVWGRVFGGLTAVAGIGLIAMPTGILAAAFSDVIQARRRAMEGETHHTED